MDSPTDQPNEPTDTGLPTDGDVEMLVRACEALGKVGRELSEEKRHITSSTVSFHSNCRIQSSGKKSQS